MYTIAGSGFGLYGYLPALARHLRAAVVLPAEYREKVESRAELADCLGRITWAKDKEEALHMATTAVIALPPTQQVEVAGICAGLSNIETVLLEKPVAETPGKAARLHELLRSAGKKTVVNYSFLYTHWLGDMARIVAAPDSARTTIDWRFKAHHFLNDIDNWKRTAVSGGGPVRFYGIHLIAALADLGYQTVATSTVERSGGEEDALWRAEFSKEGAAPIGVVVDSNSDTPVFAVRGNGEGAAASIALDDPFAGGRSSTTGAYEDRRVGVIVKMLQATRHERDEATLYPAVIALWDSVERATRTA